MRRFVTTRIDGNGDQWDWLALEIEFLKAGREKLAQFADRMGLSRSNVYNWAGKRKWLAKRRLIHGGECTDEGVALCLVCRKAITRANY